MRIWILVLLLAAPALGQDTSTVYRDNVVMVVDASGSMGSNWSGTDDEKMDIAKNAMKTVLSQIGENTQIGIVVFGNVQNDWVYPLGSKNVAAITDAINSIDVGGGTPLGTYIKKGADALVQQRQKQFGYGSYRLLIVTDGDASGWGEKDKMLQYTPEVIARGITVDVIGVDMGEKHALAQIVGSNYRKANDPTSLTKAITEVFAEVSKTGDGGKADFELLEGLDPKLAKQMIGALANPRNHPIGAKPKLLENASSSATDWDDSPDPDFGWILSGMAGVGGILVLIFAVKGLRGY